MGQDQSKFQTATTAGSSWAKVESDDDYMVMGLYFNVPLNYDSEDSNKKTITVHASLVYEKKPTASKLGPAISTDPVKVWKDYIRSGATGKPFLAYLCGGPGDGNSFTRVPGVTKFGIQRGYQILYLDYRGTGESEPFPASHNTNPSPDANELAEYLSHFTQGRIVQDLEAVRRWFNHSLTTEIKYTLLAQSFGGWIAITYLSRLASSLKSVLLTAAMPPFAKSPIEAYKALYKRVIERNEEFYRRYPDDAARLLKIVTHLHAKAADGAAYQVSGGRFLTAQTIMTLGRTFGGAGGFERVHDFLAKAAADLDDDKQPSIKPETLTMFADKSLESFRLHQRPLYGLLHEAIYCHSPGPNVSNWAALSVGLEIGRLGTKAAAAAHGHEQFQQQQQVSPKKRKAKQSQPGQKATSQSPGPFSWLDPAFDPSALPQTSKLYFSGEMIFPFMFSSHSAGTPGLISQVAEILATKPDWPRVFDVEKLKKNELNVPVRALVYKGDMYVDWEISVEMGRMIGGPCEVLLVGPQGEVQQAVLNKIVGSVRDREEMIVDEDLAGEWDWSHGAVKGKGKTEKVLRLLFDGVCW